MSIEDFLTNEFTVAGSTLLLIGLIIGVIVFALLVYIINLRTQLNSANTPTYGFLGKPLYQVAALAIIMGGLTFSVYTVTAPGTGITQTSAVEDLEYFFDYEILQRGTNYQVRYDVTPILNGQDWGGDINQTFNVFVNLSNRIEVNEFMYERNQDTGASFTKIMPPGTYDVRITIVTDNISKQFDQKITLE